MAQIMKTKSSIPAFANAFALRLSFAHRHAGTKRSNDSKAMNVSIWPHGCPRKKGSSDFSEDPFFVVLYSFYKVMGIASNVPIASSFSCP